MFRLSYTENAQVVGYLPRNSLVRQLISVRGLLDSMTVRSSRIEQNNCVFQEIHHTQLSQATTYTVLADTVLQGSGRNS